jgi:hypothetical protein
MSRADPFFGVEERGGSPDCGFVQCQGLTPSSFFQCQGLTPSSSTPSSLLWAQKASTDGNETLPQPDRTRGNSRIRAFLARAVLEHSAAIMTDLARWLKRDVSSLSSAVRRLQEKADRDGDIKRDMERLKEQIDKIATLQAWASPKTTISITFNNI